MKGKSELITREFKLSIRLPEFYNPDASLVETLKYCIENKQMNPSGLSKAA